ncbi:hypothetical protein [Halostella sp. PRR32]|uniref:DUF7289 family protein n=1 Tax=Halostella sp. PRR32 TaxID=3098147 RepID=UPI002B1DC754|nr:hypothetical protein [Halostella sp. PRR32]
MFDRDNRRGQSAVIAVVLLFGLAATVTVGILFVTTGAVSDSKQTAETERVEQAFLHLDSEVDAVSRSETNVSRSVDMDLSGSEGAVRQSGTGRIVVNTSGSSDPVVDQPLGAIVYEQDGTTFAYQAGAVWRNEGNETQVISRPDLNYRTNGSNVDHTLSLPITSFEGDQHLTGGEVTVTKQETVSPLSDISLVEGEVVTVNITSPYYTGWAEYFRENVDDSAIRELDHDENRVIVVLGQREIDGNFDTGLVASGDVTVGNRGNPDVTTEISAGGTVVGKGNVDCDAGTGTDCVTEGDSMEMMALDGVIKQRMRSVQNNSTVVTSLPPNNELDEGTYYLDDDLHLSSQDLEVDVGTGNVTLFVNGSVALDGQAIRVVNDTGTDTALRVYMTGDMAVSNGGGGAYVDSGNPGRLQIYGTSQMHFALGQGDFTGSVYAPRNTPATGTNEAADRYASSATSSCQTGIDVCLATGGGSVTGSIIAGPMEVANIGEFEYDDRLENVEPTLPTAGVVPPPITYLHASVHKVEIENSA